jgi:hypothetical protein
MSQSTWQEENPQKALDKATAFLAQKQQQETN